jgi:hypothetical protein
MISMRSEGLVIDTNVCLTLAKWETVSGQFGGYFTRQDHRRGQTRAPGVRFRPLVCNKDERFCCLKHQYRRDY